MNSNMKKIVLCSKVPENSLFMAIFTMAALCFLVSQQVLAQRNDSIPFIYRGHIFIPSTINDSVHCNVIYDTGAANMYGVDSVFFQYCGWNPQHLGYATTGGGAGNTKVRVIADKSKVNIGNIEDRYDVVPIFKLRDVVDCHADGIWGIKNVADYPFEINFEHSYLKQYKTGNPSLDGYQKLPIRYENNRIMLPAETRVGGTVVKGWFLMDTGSGSTVDFTAKTVQDYQLESIPGKRYINDWTQFGIGDKKQEWDVDILSDIIIIGNDTIHKKPVSYIPEGTGAFSDRPYLGIVGNTVWSKYNIIIDIKNNSLWLRRFSPDSPQRPKYDFGFRNRTDICRGWIVSCLTREGDAVKAGMELGDTIIAVNGKNVTEYSWEEEYNIDNLPNIVLDVIGVDGKEKQISLESKERW